MNDLASALQWTGGDRTEITVFVVTTAPGVAGTFDFPPAPHGAPDVFAFPIEDELGVLPGRDIGSYDVAFDGLPDDLAGYIAACLRAAVTEETVLAWCGFEGSFDLRHLLTPDVAPLIYGLVVPGEEPVVATTDDELASPEWRERVRRCQAVLRTS